MDARVKEIEARLKEAVDDAGNEFCSQECLDEYHKPEPEIVTVFVYPPIPLRKFDWCAYYEGTEESGNYGWGATEDDAIASLDSGRCEIVDTEAAKEESHG